MTSLIVSRAVSKLQQRIDLSESEAHDIALSFLTGEASTDDIVSILSLLHDKGESCDEITGFIRAMRTHMTPITFRETPLIDTCGTGGSHPNRFNVSTCVAMVLGCMGHYVAKHGNRGSKKANGSFDFLEALEIPFEGSPHSHQTQLSTHGSTFLFARHHHPAVRHVADARSLLKTRSIFNLVGPFCNPASPSIHVVGCPSMDLAKTLLSVGQSLDYEVFAVITSDIGLDECSTVGLSHALINRHGDTESLTIDPKALGIHHQLNDISVSSNALAIDNARKFCDIIKNKRMDHPIATLIALNAGLIRHIISPELPLKDAFNDARSALFSNELSARINC